MQIFTSTGLTSLLYRSLRAMDSTLVAGIAPPDPMNQAIVSDADKQQLIERALGKYGPAALLQVGQYLHLADETPVLTVLVRSTEPAVLAEKFMRLERYHHSAHRTRITPIAPTAWACTRTSKARPATSGENCLIAGLLCGLLGVVGVENCRLRIGTQTLTASKLPPLHLAPELSVKHFVIVR